jgi:hypothetical protein
MAKPSKSKIVSALLDRHGQTYAREAGFTVKDSPSSLYRLLCLSTLLSARIGANIAVAAARALADNGWTTPRKMADATWAERTKVLNRSGYARYDERTSRMLGDSAELLIDRWGGDLRKLRDEAGKDPSKERSLLKQFKGMGDTGVDIFFREVQATWSELAPFIDRRALDAADRLGLGKDSKAIGRLVKKDDLPVFVTALLRAGREKTHDEILSAAA